MPKQADVIASYAKTILSQKHELEANEKYIVLAEEKIEIAWETVNRLRFREDELKDKVWKLEQLLQLYLHKQ